MDAIDAVRIGVGRRPVSPYGADRAELVGAGRAMCGGGPSLGGDAKSIPIFELRLIQPLAIQPLASGPLVLRPGTLCGYTAGTARQGGDGMHPSYACLIRLGGGCSFR